VSASILQRLADAHARYEARASAGHLAAAEREFLNEALRLARFAATAVAAKGSEKAKEERWDAK
jgi:hypothetical protein